MLADGQQIAVAGIHPDTKEPFRWRNGLSPVNTSRAELPLVNEDEVRAMLDLIAEELKNRLKWVEADAAPAADANGHDTGATYVPISERVERMQYGGECPMNDTLLAYSGEQLRGGAPSDDVIKDCLARAQKAYDDIPGDPQERPIWDWTKMRHQIDAMVYGYIEKNYKGEPYFRLSPTSMGVLLRSSTTPARAPRAKGMPCRVGMTCAAAAAFRVRCDRSAWSMSCQLRRRPGCKSPRQTAAVTSASPMKRRITRHQGMVDGSS